MSPWGRPFLKLPLMDCKDIKALSTIQNSSSKEVSEDPILFLLFDFLSYEELQGKENWQISFCLIYPVIRTWLNLSKLFFIVNTHIKYALLYMDQNVLKFSFCLNSCGWNVMEPFPLNLLLFLSRGPYKLFQYEYVFLHFSI